MMRDWPICGHALPGRLSRKAPKAAMRKPRAINHPDTSMPSSNTSNEPDFDSLVLDDEYYKEVRLLGRRR